MAKGSTGSPIGSGLGVSLPAIQVARAVDRLGPGEYIIRLVKPPHVGDPWEVEIARAETVQRLKVGGRPQ